MTKRSVKLPVIVEAEVEVELFPKGGDVWVVEAIVGVVEV